MLFNEAFPPLSSCLSSNHSCLFAVFQPSMFKLGQLKEWARKRQREKTERERERSPKSIPRLEVVTVRRGACCCSAHGTCWHVSLWPAWTRMWSCRGSCPRPLLPWASPARCAQRRRSHARSTSPGATAQNARAGPVLLCAGTRGRDGTKINKYTTRGFHTVWF